MDAYTTATMSSQVRQKSQTFYKRPLPSPPAVGFSTPEGRALFQVLKTASSGKTFSTARGVNLHSRISSALKNARRFCTRLPQEALAAGFLEGYFPLAEQFTTQVLPSFCGLASLAMVLNALQVDPGRVWQGSWRRADPQGSRVTVVHSGGNDRRIKAAGAGIGFRLAQNGTPLRRFNRWFDEYLLDCCEPLEKARATARVAAPP